MEANRLRASRKTIVRVAVAFVTPFYKTKNDKNNKTRDKYSVLSGGDKKNVVEGVLTYDLEYTGTEQKRRTPASAGRTATVTPTPTEAGSPRYPPMHIGILCKDYNIFRVAYYKVKKIQMDDYIDLDLLKSKSLAKSSFYNKSEKTTTDFTCRHIGNHCKDYSIFQIQVADRK
ncbi:hypothetical protein ScPMuIL_003869 [Solemya velum]